MKKLIVLMAFFCCLCSHLSADVYKTKCGEEFTSVDAEAFDSEEEFYEWLAEMEEILCGRQ